MLRDLDIYDIKEVQYSLNYKDLDVDGMKIYRVDSDFDDIGYKSVPRKVNIDLGNNILNKDIIILGITCRLCAINTGFYWTTENLFFSNTSWGYFENWFYKPCNQSPLFVDYKATLGEVVVGIENNILSLEIMREDLADFSGNQALTISKFSEVRLVYKKKNIDLEYLDIIYSLPNKFNKKEVDFVC